MRPLDRVRGWLSRPEVFVPTGFFIMAFLIYSDSRALLVSPLWGSGTWLWAALAGVAVATMGLIMAWLSMRRQATGAGDRGRLPGLGVAYMAGVLLMFLFTHSHRSGVAQADTPLVVAMLSCQVALIVGLVIVLAGARLWSRRTRR